MDNIKFVVEEADALEGSPYKDYDVSVYLNDKKLPHNTFNAAKVLPIYKYHFVEFDLFTCGCGVAGCAGFHSPVTHTIKDGIVTWTFPKEDDYKTDKKVYQFKEKEVTKAFKDLIKSMSDLEKENIIHTTLVRDEAMYGYQEEGDTDFVRFEVTSSLKDSIKWYANRYQGEQNFNDMLKQTYPDLVNKSFKYTYHGVEGKEEYELSSLVCRLINQYPRKAKEKAFLEKCQLAVQAIVDFTNGDVTEFKNLAHQSFEDHNMDSQYLISWDFPEVNDENHKFDFEQVKLFMKEKSI